MKNTVKMLLCLMICLMLFTSAFGAECAGRLVDHEELLRYPSYVCDQETGKWTVHAYQADALMDRFWEYGMRSSQRMIAFHLAAEGDVRTGVWTPVLRIYHIDGGMIRARAVSILVDGQRFDLAASSESVTHSRHTAERITVPLNRQGMQVAAAMENAENVMIRLIGNEEYTVSVNRSATAERQGVEGASLGVMPHGLALLRELGVENYDLWDLSAAAWEKEYGYLPAVTQGSVENMLCEKRLTDKMGMVLPDASGDAAVAAQEKLIEFGFLNGTAYWKMTDEAEEAVLRAQKYLGRVPTGCVDAALLEAMAEGRAVENTPAPAMQPVGETAEVSLERYWFAGGVSASANVETLRTTANSDNVFLAADGFIRNMSAQELHLFMQMEANVVYNGKYAYEAELAVETSGGTELDTRLLPMAQARLLAYAEIPAALAEDANAQWSVVFELEGESLTIDLE